MSTTEQQPAPEQTTAPTTDAPEQPIKVESAPAAASAPITPAAAAQVNPPPPPEVASTEPVPAASEPTLAPEPGHAAPTQPDTKGNALTASFTENEWASIRSLREKLPAILHSSLSPAPTDPTASKIAEVKEDEKVEAQKIWGVELHPEKEDAKSSVVLYKFLKARKFDVNQAADMLVSTLRWRREFKAAETIHESFPEDVFGTLGFLAGKSKSGEPVTYNLYGTVKSNEETFGDLNRFLRWRVKLMEQGIALLDFENISSGIQVHDYLGVSMTSRDAHTKKAAAEASKLFSDHYPELLSAKYFLNVPTLMYYVYKAFTFVLPAATVAKFQVVGQYPDQIRSTLLQKIDDDQLPERYGGQLETPA